MGEDERAVAELGIIPGALALPLDSLRSTMYQLDPDRPTVVYCATGNRSLAAMSLLAANGFRDVCEARRRRHRRRIAARLAADRPPQPDRWSHHR
jgi:hypothetical protein